MDNRIELHEHLLEHSANVYFQPPATIRMNYPSIVYHKSDKQRNHGNNRIYQSNQQYQITVISPDPDSLIADALEESFSYCTITNYMTVDNLNHVQLTLYY